MYQAVEHPENDPGFETFSLERVRKYIIPAIKDVISHSATPLDILLSPWSPPACWKTEPFYTVLGANAPEILKKTMPEEKPKKGTRCWGGHLKRENYPDWARYIVRYIKEYLKEGLPVKWISVQNESLANTPWDSCIWTADEEKTFLRDHLYPELLKNGLSDKIGIFIWDHNKERIYERAVSEIDDTTNNMVRGIAFHWYSGDHFEAVKLTRDRFPDKELMFTEGCVEYSVAGAQSKRQFAERYAHDIIGDINSGMNRWFDWNLYLDSKGGPNHVGNYCAAPIMLDGKGSFSIEPTYYYIKEFSSNIRRGARLTGFSRFTDKLEITSLKNPDGSICIIILNRSKDDININLRISGNLLKVQSFSHSIMDLVSV
jgi:glucosylceramidase